MIIPQTTRNVNPGPRVVHDFHLSESILFHGRAMHEIHDSGAGPEGRAMRPAWCKTVSASALTKGLI